MNDKDVITVISAHQSYQLTHNTTNHVLANRPFISETFTMLDTTTEQITCLGESYSPVIRSIVGIILVFIAIATVGGNFLVIFAVTLVKKLRTPSNILIVSLAFSDLFVGFLVLPFSIIDALAGYWPFNEGLCDMYISLDVLLCTSSILNLCAISIDRYLVITRPFTYVSRRTPCRMAQMIVAAWVISALISVPPNIGWKTPFEQCKCEYSKNVGYQIYATFCAFYLPLLVMIVLYGRIFKLAREMSRAEQKQLRVSSADGAQTTEPEQKDNDDTKGDARDGDDLLNRLATLPEENYMCSAANVRSHKNSSKMNELGCNTNQSNNFSVNKTDKPVKGLTDHEKTYSETDRSFRNGRSLSKLKSSSKDSATAFLERRNSNTPNDRSSSSVELQRRKSRAYTDSKVIKTLGVIMGCFCLCWLPFFIVQLLLALLTASGYNTENMIPIAAFRFLLWLGYVNSFLNPIIYAKYNREFRLPFKMILLCQCRNINARLRSATFSAQYGLPSNQSRRNNSWIHSVSYRSKRRLHRDETLHTNCDHQSRPRPPSHLHLIESPQ